MQVNAHIERLHRKSAPSDKSFREIEEQLLGLDPQTIATTRWRGESLSKLDAGVIQEARELLGHIGHFEDLFLRRHSSPWLTTALGDGDSPNEALDTARAIAHECLPSLMRAMVLVGGACALSLSATLTHVTDTLAVAETLAAALSPLSEKVLAENVDSLLRDFAPASRGKWAGLWAICTNSAFRKARARARLVYKEPRVSMRRLYSDLTRFRESVVQWRLQSGLDSPPTADLTKLRNAALRLHSELARFAALIPLERTTQLTLTDLMRLFESLAADAETPLRLSALRQMEGQLSNVGLDHFVAELKERKSPSFSWEGMLNHAWFSSCREAVLAKSPELAAFHGRHHDHVVADLRSSDRKRRNLAAQRVRRAHAERAIATMNRCPEQEAFIRRECQKRSRLKPLRQLVTQAPDVLLALTPCWMASPLSVSQLIPGDRQYFDVCIFDEASQVLPQDAVTAIVRARQIVVAGDRHQLPPTPFFADGGGEDDANEEEHSTSGFESLLDVVSSVAHDRMLKWHYRSADERLIAFSNKHIYDGQLVTFPGVGGESVISHVLVKRETSDVGVDSDAAEVERVVDLILEHATTRAHESLGVIAMGLTHARRIEALLKKRRKDRSDLESFWSAHERKPFFVKNLERVQGDERDAIILSVGYGRQRAGRLLHNFGPLNQEGGERRFNVAVTRACRRMTIVSTFGHYDMDPDRASGRGVELLRLYLEYAASGGHELKEARDGFVPLNAFELDIFDALSARKISLLPQWGASGYRIDMVAQHPERPGRFVLAIECDGASYHSSPTARDRDRLRQEHLESLGWRFLRIWSTDWFTRRDSEIERAVEAYQSAVAAASLPAAGQPHGTENDSKGRTESSAVHPGRGPKPHLPKPTSIRDYSDEQLDRLVLWVRSDQLLRSDEELTDDVMKELPFARRGALIDDAIRRALGRTRPG
jgi:very-short-patch-repair endonuclease